MGFYIDPQNRTKEVWLEMFGQEVGSPEWPPPKDMIPVCLIDNGPFTAAGIAYCEQEFYKFLAPDSTPEEIAAAKQRIEAAGSAFYSLDSGRQRPRTWYYVPIEKIIEVAPEVTELIPN